MAEHKTLSTTDANRIEAIIAKRGNGVGITATEQDEFKKLRESEIHKGS